MGLIPQRMLKETVTSRDYALKCDCDRPAAFVGLFRVQIADSINLIPEALFLCESCAAMVDDGVELHSLREKAIREEIETFAQTKQIRIKAGRLSDEERKRRKLESDRRRYDRLKGSADWRERRRRYQETYRAKSKAEQQQQGAGND